MIICASPVTERENVRHLQTEHKSFYIIFHAENNSKSDSNGNRRDCILNIFISTANFFSSHSLVNFSADFLELTIYYDLNWTSIMSIQRRF